MIAVGFLLGVLLMFIYFSNKMMKDGPVGGKLGVML